MLLQEIIQTTINKLSKHPKKRYIYAVTGGKLLGELLVYINSNKDTHSFLSLPIMKNRAIPIDKFDFGIKERIVDVVEKIPKNIYSVCIKQYNKNIEDDNILA